MYTSADADDVICFAGAEEALYLAMQVLLEPDDHAVVITPNYHAAETVPLSLCQVSGVALDPDHDWALDLDQVVAAIRPGTRVVSVNFPNNPTGEEFCTRLVDEAGVLLLPASIYRSELTATPTDRFRVGIGRLDPEPALDGFAAWLRARR